MVYLLDVVTFHEIYLFDMRKLYYYIYQLDSGMSSLVIQWRSHMKWGYNPKRFLVHGRISWRNWKLLIGPESAFFFYQNDDRVNIFD